MLHAVYFNKSSQGKWKISYRNKFVDSDTFQLEREKNEVAFVPSVDGQPYAILVAFVLNIVCLTLPVKIVAIKGKCNFSKKTVGIKGKCNCNIFL